VLACYDRLYFADSNETRFITGQSIVYFTIVIDTFLNVLKLFLRGISARFVISFHLGCYILGSKK